MRLSIFATRRFVDHRRKLKSLGYVHPVAVSSSSGSAAYCVVLGPDCGVPDFQLDEKDRALNIHFRLGSSHFL